MNAEQIATLERRGFVRVPDEPNPDGYQYRGIGNDTYVTGLNGAASVNPAGWPGPFLIQSVRNGTADTTVTAADTDNAVRAAVRFAGGNPDA